MEIGYVEHPDTSWFEQPGMNVSEKLLSEHQAELQSDTKPGKHENPG